MYSVNKQLFTKIYYGLLLVLWYWRLLVVLCDAPKILPFRCTMIQFFQFDVLLWNFKFPFVFVWNLVSCDTTKCPHSLWQRLSLYNGHPQGPVTLAPVADGLAVELSLPVFNSLALLQLGIEPWSPTCEEEACRFADITTGFSVKGFINSIYSFVYRLYF